MVASPLSPTATHHPSRVVVAAAAAAVVAPVKEHPFGVCDACRRSCTGKSRVTAHNCTATPNAKRSADRRQLGQWRFVPPMIMVTLASTDATCTQPTMRCQRVATARQDGCCRLRRTSRPGGMRTIARDRGKYQSRSKWSNLGKELARKPHQPENSNFNKHLLKNNFKITYAYIIFLSSNFLNREHNKYCWN